MHKYWNGMHRNVVLSLSLEIFSTQLDITMSSLVWFCAAAAAKKLIERLPYACSNLKVLTVQIILILILILFILNLQCINCHLEDRINIFFYPYTATILIWEACILVPTSLGIYHSKTWTKQFGHLFQRKPLILGCSWEVEHEDLNTLTHFL